MRKTLHPLTGITILVAALLLGLGLALLPNRSVQAQSAPDGPVVIYFFWGDGCPHCAEAEPFLADLSKRYPQVEIKAYEVWNVKENQEIMAKMAGDFGFTPSGVPTIFIGDQYWVGYNDTIGEQIETAIQDCSKTGCRDAGTELISGSSAVENQLPGEVVRPRPQTSGVLKVPLIGEINLESQSLMVSTALIAFVDGFNPCSLWVLSMLLALTLHTGSRKKVVLIGLIFLTVTAAVYALFIAGLFTMFTVISFVGWIQVVVALVALFFAAVNIKDYFWYKEGISFTIADDKKPGIYQRIRRIMDASQSFWGLAGATVVMAAGVSLVEFSCTAGFPVLWTNLLAAQKVGAAVFVMLLLLYILIYQLDELAIFFTAVFTLKASRLEEKQGRILKLVGGMLMLTLAGVMLFNPNLMNNLSSSLLIFGAALVGVLLVLLVHRAILPSFGIWIGTEARVKNVRARTRKHH